MYRSRMLIVEDDRDVCLTTTKAFSRMGYLVHEAFDGSFGLEMARRYPYDILLLDYRLPDMNGLELYERIKRMQPDAACVIVTAHATVDMIEAAMDAGVRRVLPKPVDVPEIIAAVEELACATK